MDPSLLLLGVPSALVLLALVWHAATNRGIRDTALYFGWLAVYGVLRSWAVRWVSADRLGSGTPYLMSRPAVSLAGVSLQEVAGWALAVTLALVLCDRLLRRMGITPTPHRLAAAAALGLAAICLAVENGAIAAGWWTWTLSLPRGVVRVPPVAVLDWAFVAFDALLPYLVFATPSPPASRAVAVGLFPLHMLGHTWVQPLPEPVPVAGNDLVHVAIAAYVLCRAFGEEGRPALAEPAVERAPLLPPLGALVVALAPVVALLVNGGNAASSVASLPLALLAMAAFTRMRPRAATAPAGPATLARAAARTAVLLAAVAVLVFVRAPATRRQQALVAGIEGGAARLNAGDTAGAEAAFRGAVAVRPDHPGARTFLALALLRQGKRAEARHELEEALASQPTSRDALEMLTSLDLSERRFEVAAQRAALGRRVYPERAAFAYQAALAEGLAGPGRPPAAEAVAVASRAGPAALAELGALARAFGDEATAEACAAAAR